MAGGSARIEIYDAGGRLDGVCLLNSEPVALEPTEASAPSPRGQSRTRSVDRGAMSSLVAAPAAREAHAEAETFVRLSLDAMKRGDLASSLASANAALATLSSSNAPASSQLSCRAVRRRAAALEALGDPVEAVATYRGALLKAGRERRKASKRGAGDCDGGDGRARSDASPSTTPSAPVDALAAAAQILLEDVLGAAWQAKVWARRIEGAEARDPRATLLVSPREGRLLKHVTHGAKLAPKELETHVLRALEAAPALLRESQARLVAGWRRGDAGPPRGDLALFRAAAYASAGAHDQTLDDVIVALVREDESARGNVLWGEPTEGPGAAQDGADGGERAPASLTEGGAEKRDAASRALVAAPAAPPPPSDEWCCGLADLAAARRCRSSTALALAAWARERRGENVAALYLATRAWEEREREAERRGEEDAGDAEAASGPGAGAGAAPHPSLYVPSASASPVPLFGEPLEEAIERLRRRVPPDAARVVAVERLREREGGEEQEEEETGSSGDGGVVEEAVGGGGASGGGALSDVDVGGDGDVVESTRARRALSPAAPAYSSAALETLLSAQVEAQKPEIMKQRPKYYYFYEWMRGRIAERYPSLPGPVVDKLLSIDANELDLLLQYPKATDRVVRDLQLAFARDGERGVAARPIQLVTWEETQDKDQVPELEGGNGGAGGGRAIEGGLGGAEDAQAIEGRVDGAEDAQAIEGRVDGAEDAQAIEGRVDGGHSEEASKAQRGRIPPPTSTDSSSDPLGASLVATPLSPASSSAARRASSPAPPSPTPIGEDASFSFCSPVSPLPGPTVSALATSASPTLSSPPPPTPGERKDEGTTRGNSAAPSGVVRARTVGAEADVDLDCPSSPGSIISIDVGIDDLD